MIKANLPAGFQIDADRIGEKIYGYRITAPCGRLVCFGVGKLFAEAQAQYHAGKPCCKDAAPVGQAAFNFSE